MSYPSLISFTAPTEQLIEPYNHMIAEKSPCTSLSYIFPNIYTPYPTLSLIKTFMYTTLFYDLSKIPVPYIKLPHPRTPSNQYSQYAMSHNSHHLLQKHSNATVTISYNSLNTSNQLLIISTHITFSLLFHASVHHIL